MRNGVIAKFVMLLITVFSATLVTVYIIGGRAEFSSARGLYSDTLYRSMPANLSVSTVMAAEDEVLDMNIDAQTVAKNIETVSAPDGITDRDTDDTVSGEAFGNKSVDEGKEIKTVSVFNHKTNSVSKMPLEEYVACVVTAEMPADSPFEALCAQAVAVRTLAVNYILSESKAGHMEADICTDSGHCQSFVTKEEFEARYGERGTQVFENARNAANATRSLILLYDDQPIVAVFHASSGGSTASGKEVWGGDLAYLAAVETAEIYDETLKSKVVSEVVFTREEFLARLADADIPGLSEYKESPFHLWIGNKERSSSGRVANLTIGGKEFTGAQVRKLLGLKSTDFEIGFGEDTVTFITEGYGHGVGMSQLGAVAMARKGESFYSILATYYPGTIIGII